MIRRVVKIRMELLFVKDNGETKRLLKKEFESPSDTQFDSQEYSVGVDERYCQQYYYQVADGLSEQVKTWLASNEVKSKITANADKTFYLCCTKSVEIDEKRKYYGTKRTLYTSDGLEFSANEGIIHVASEGAVAHPSQEDPVEFFVKDSGFINNPSCNLVDSNNINLRMHVEDPLCVIL